MRIRSTKPEFWRSETIASLDWEVRLVLKGIESYVDDNGVGKDSVALICADVFPHDLARDLETLARVSRALRKLAEANLIARYTIAGESLLYVRKWKSIQRVDKPAAGRFPRPDGTLNYGEPVDESIGAGSSVSDGEPEPAFEEPSRDRRETVANTPETLAPGTGEQGNRGTGEQKEPATRVAADPAAPLFPVEPTKTTTKTPAKTKPKKTPTPEQSVTKNVYDRTGGAINFAAVLGIVKWAIQRGTNPTDVEEVLVALYEAGKPITRQIVGQWLDGHIGPNRQPGPSRQDEKVRGFLESGRRLAEQYAAEAEIRPIAYGEIER